MKTVVKYETRPDGVMKTTKAIDLTGLVVDERSELISYDDYLGYSAGYDKPCPMEADPRAVALANQMAARVEVARPGDWIQTYTGKRFYILDPRPEDICIEDIAHSLSLQCRYLGHAKWHYSVAQHCVLLAENEYSIHLNATSAFNVLMHDAGEAYYGDWPRPIKNSVPSLKNMMVGVDKAIQKKYNLFEEPEWLKMMDLAIVCDEKKVLMKEQNGWVYIGKEPLGVKIDQWTPEQAELAFLGWFDYLSRERTQ